MGNGALPSAKQQLRAVCGGVSPFPQPVNSVNSAVSDSCMLLRGEISLNPQHVLVPPSGSHHVPTFLPAPQVSPGVAARGPQQGWCRHGPPSANASAGPGTGLEPSRGQGKGAQQGDKARFNIFLKHIFLLKKKIYFRTWGDS